MKSDAFLHDMMTGSRILRPPKHSLATFGTTTLRYVLLSAVTDPQGNLPARQACRLREGEVTAQRPAILTPDLWRKRFEGFGEEVESYQDVMTQQFGDAFRALEYTFHNHLRSTTLEHAPFPEVAERAMKKMASEDAPRTALLQGPDHRWPLSVMKFIVEMSLRSFPGNVRELDEHGMFNPEQRRDRQQRAMIEKLFQDARKDPALIKNLGEVLKNSGLFSDYEDRFFSLVRR